MVPISDDPARFSPGSRLLHEDGRELVVVASRRHRDRLLVTFEGHADRDRAATLRGALYVDPSQARSLEAGEFWVHELVGLAVRSLDGDPAGTVAEVRPGPAQDLLVLDTPAGERLVPMTAGIVVNVDVARGEIVVDPPDGLLE